MNPIAVHPEILNGIPCFTGTRVPVHNLFDYLSHGQTLDEFLQQFPSVTREQALAVVGLAGKMLLQASLTAATIAGD